MTRFENDMLAGDESIEMEKKTVDSEMHSALASLPLVERELAEILVNGLVEITYKKGLINEATYKKIMKGRV